jgi:hypothetical protein
LLVERLLNQTSLLMPGNQRLESVTILEILIINALPRGKALGLNGITNVILKQLQWWAVEGLCCLINSMIALGRLSMALEDGNYCDNPEDITTSNLRQAHTSLSTSCQSLAK